MVWTGRGEGGRAWGAVEGGQRKTLSEEERFLLGKQPTLNSTTVTHELHPSHLPTPGTSLKDPRGSLLATGTSPCACASEREKQGEEGREEGKRGRS